MRQECLNENWFLSLEDAREKVEPGGRATAHTAPGNLTPAEFARQVVAAG